jgi:peptide chain release factor
MILLQLSSAQGPLECCLAVGKALSRIQQEARSLGVSIDVLEAEPASRENSFRSVLLALDGEEAGRLLCAWEGSVLWTCVSPYRPRHPRKNWYIGIARCALVVADLSGEIRFETTRSSGPGGQHVNKTETAVRATHLRTGISVKVQSERSQHANKRLAEHLIAYRLAGLASEIQAGAKSDRRLLHYRVERGNPVRTFAGPDFEEANAR